MARFAKSRLAARLQMLVSERRLESGLYGEIADHLPLKDGDTVLDVGTGTGLMLKAIVERNPGVHLFGLDISQEAVKCAREQLTGLTVDLRQGDITSTNYENDFFDIVTCNASMSYWERPLAAFDEIFRILRPGGQALLFEPRANIDVDHAIERIKENMADKSIFRRWLAAALNRFGLTRGDKVGMKRYSAAELCELAARSRFNPFFKVDKIALQGIPIFARITLTKTLE